ncbi:uncharacterized protein CBL_05584 [Carabus blaptoides fortunei]
MFRKALANVYNLHKLLNVASAQILVKSSVANMSGTGSEIADYDDVVAATKHKSVYIIDVREPSEVKDGAIPNSINIPLGDIENALRNISGEDFAKKYGRAKPTYDSPIILSCRSGKRAGTALEIVRRLGFNNLRNYAGSWLDWESKRNE